MQISALVPQIFKFEKWVKYANKMTDDVIHSTQYYIEYVNRAILANPKGSTPIAIKKFRSHGNSLFPSSHPLDFNMLVIFQYANVG